MASDLITWRGRALIGGILGLLAGILWVPYAMYSRECPPLAVLAVITQFYTAFQNNLWVAAAMRGIRAAVVPIMISAVLGMVGRPSRRR